MLLATMNSFIFQRQGMMSTLFIGTQDKVFDWKEHKDALMLGTIIGVVLLVLVLGLNALATAASFGRKKPYSAVALNELKSKAQD